MKHFAAKILITLACGIIMMHAVVPHHHHDCCDEVGIVFESELDCDCSCEEPLCEEHHCHHHDGGSHHPMNHCRLQDLLAQLVISHKNEELLMALESVVEMDLYASCGFACGWEACLMESADMNPLEAPPTTLPLETACRDVSRRGPPLA